METLRINRKEKTEVIKLINKFRLQNKNNWYQVSVNYGGFTYQIKAYNTWVQILNKIDNLTSNKVYSDSGIMDINVSQFKQFLDNHIK